MKLKQPQSTVWTEFPAPDATTDRGWFKAIASKPDDRRKYTRETMPVWDEEINAFREQSTLGNYLDYGPCWQGALKYYRKQYPDGFVHAVCYPAHTTGWFRTVQEAKEWIEKESMRVRPELVIQRRLALSASPFKSPKQGLAVQVRRAGLSDGSEVLPETEEEN